MSPVPDLIGALLGLALIVLGAQGLRLRRVTALGRRRTGAWKHQGLGRLAVGTTLLSIYGSWVVDVRGWPRVWIIFAGVLIALGLFAVVLWDDYRAWDDARQSTNRR